METLVADRVERPASLFDLLDGPGPAAAPAPAPAERSGGLERRLLREREAEAEARVAEPEIDAGGVGHLHDGVGGEPTLDDLLVGAWEGLTAQAAVPCPLCEGTVRPYYADGAAGSPVSGGRCDSCDTTLS